MRAMILAAGLGTRLRPLTNDRPKALVEINGRTLLEINLARLRDAGVTDVIVNTHHFADKIEAHLTRRDYGMRVEISREDVLLDTGGGLKKAAWFFLEQGSDEPFLLHNVDVLSDIDFARMLQLHRERSALATLAVQDRPSSRRLVFDRELRLIARENQTSASGSQAFAFCGIHVISPAILPLMQEDGAFSIVDVYTRLAQQERILGFRADEYHWRDVGTLEAIRAANGEARA
jgi:NDP-sugar pyrophosphorylase family protein